MERSWKVPHGDPIDLNEDERLLVEDIRNRLASIHARLSSHDSIAQTDIADMGETAHKLHMLLANRGFEPRHHKYMLKNRGVDPRSTEFYKHIHPVEDLLRFVGNPHANDDPIDITIGHEFDFRVYSRRWGHDDLYKVTRTKAGWTFSHNDEIPTGRDARVGRKDGTGLFHLLNHDSINFPDELPGYFEWLWEQAAESGLDHDEVQSAITDLAKWTSICEKESPGGIFETYK